MYFPTPPGISLVKQCKVNLYLKTRNDEPASELLEKIKAEKEKLITEGKLKKPKLLPEIKEEEIPYEIPKNWVWCIFGELCELINGDRSKNYPNRHEYVTSGIPWINTGHIEPGGTTYKKGYVFYFKKEVLNYLRSGKIKRRRFSILFKRGNIW